MARPTADTEVARLTTDSVKRKTLKVPEITSVAASAAGSTVVADAPSNIVPKPDDATTAVNVAALHTLLLRLEKQTGIAPGAAPAEPSCAAPAEMLELEAMVLRVEAAVEARGAQVLAVSPEAVRVILAPMLFASVAPPPPLTLASVAPPWPPMSPPPPSPPMSPPPMRTWPTRTSADTVPSAPEAPPAEEPSPKGPPPPPASASSSWYTGLLASLGRSLACIQKGAVGADSTDAALLVARSQLLVARLEAVAGSEPAPFGATQLPGPEELEQLQYVCGRLEAIAAKRGV